MSNNDIGQVILHLRLKQGLTVEELSYKANISRSQLYYLETGKRNTTFNTVNKVISALGYDIVALLQECV